MYTFIYIYIYIPRIPMTIVLVAVCLIFIYNILVTFDQKNPLGLPHFPCLFASVALATEIGSLDHLVVTESERLSQYCQKYTLKLHGVGVS